MLFQNFGKRAGQRFPLRQRTHARHQRIAAHEMEGQDAGLLRALDMRPPVLQHRPQGGLLRHRHVGLEPWRLARRLQRRRDPLPLPLQPRYQLFGVVGQQHEPVPCAAHLHIQHRPVRHHARRVHHRDHVVPRQPLRPVNGRAPGVVDMAQIVVVDREAEPTAGMRAYIDTVPGDPLHRRPLAVDQPRRRMLRVHTISSPARSGSGRDSQSERLRAALPEGANARVSPRRSRRTPSSPVPTTVQASPSRRPYTSRLATTTSPGR